MAFNTRPNALYVEKFAKGRLDYYTNQAEDDTKAFGLIYKTRPVETANLDGRGRPGLPIRPIRTGYGGISHARNVAVLSTPPGFKFNPPDNSIAMQLHSSLLESWIGGFWKQSQIEDTWTEGIGDLLAYGRAFLPLWVVPKTWAGELYKEMVDERVRLVEENGKGGRLGDLEKRMEDYRRSNFPFRWLHEDAANVWPLLSKERYLPEIISMRKMTVEEIKAEYGDSALPEGTNDSSPLDALDVYIYTNWYHTATVIGGSKGVGFGSFRVGGSEGKLVEEWRHDYGKNPYGMIETNTLPMNDRRVRWKSTLFDYQDMIEGLDEAMSDARNIMRRFTLAPIVLKLNPELRAAATWPTTIDYDPAKPWIAMLQGESMEAGAAPAFNRDFLEYVAMLARYNEMITLNPAERGQLLSGTSALSIAITNQQAQVRLDPYARAIQAYAERWVDLAFRGVGILGEKVYVSKVGGKVVGAGPRDVEGWADRVQAKVSHTMPINRGQQMSLYTQAINNGLPKSWAMSQYLDVEHPEVLMDLYDREQIHAALLEDKKTKAVALSNELAKILPAQDLAGFAADVQNLPPAALAALAKRGFITPALGPGPGTQPGSQGAQRQGASNEARGAAMTGQGLSQTLATEIEPRVPSR